MTDSHGTITRRELLKRGAIIGGAALWATPVVQTVGMGRAYAAATSPVCSIYCIVWRPSLPGSPSNWAVSEGDKCLPCPSDTIADLPPDIAEFSVVYDDGARTYTVTYPDTYELLKADSSPDDLINGFAAIRRGENVNSCDFVAADIPVPPDKRQVQFTNWDAASGDRIELVIRACV